MPGIRKFDWKMENLRPATRRLPAKMAGIAGGRMMGCECESVSHQPGLGG